MIKPEGLRIMSKIFKRTWRCNWLYRLITGYSYCRKCIKDNDARDLRINETRRKYSDVIERGPTGSGGWS